MNIVKCPNPSCPFQFDASLVPAGATIACPQCRLQFQLPAAPTNFTPAPLPEPEVEPLQPDSADDDTAPRRPLRKRREQDDADFEDQPKRKRGRGRDEADDDLPPPKKGNSAALLALVAVGLVVLCGGGVVGLGFAFGWFGGKKGGGEAGEIRYNEYALTLNGPGDGWAKDDDTKKALKVKLAAFKRADPEGYVAVTAERTEGTASKVELMPKAVKLLRDAFDDVEDQLTPSEAMLLGEKAQKYPFSGRYKATGTGCQGEVYAVAVRDIQVWVFTWGDRDKYDQLTGQLDKFRGSIKLDPPKPGATVKIQEKQFRTPLGLYQIIDKDDQWKQQGNPKSQEELADLWLTGTPKGGGKGNEAQLVVAVLEQGADAKAHVIAQFDDDKHKADQSPVEAEPDGDDPPSGKVAVQADVVRVKLTYPGTDKSANKFVVYKLVDSGGKRVVAYASCGLKQMGYWEQRMMGVVGSLKGLK